MNKTMIECKMCKKSCPLFSHVSKFFTKIVNEDMGESYFDDFLQEEIDGPYQCTGKYYYQLLFPELNADVPKKSLTDIVKTIKAKPIVSITKPTKAQVSQILYDHRDNMICAFCLPQFPDFYTNTTNTCEGVRYIQLVERNHWERESWYIFIPYTVTKETMCEWLSLLRIYKSKMNNIDHPELDNAGAGACVAIATFRVVATDLESIDGLSCVASYRNDSIEDELSLESLKKFVNCEQCLKGVLQWYKGNIHMECCHT